MGGPDLSPPIVLPHSRLLGSPERRRGRERPASHGTSRTANTAPLTRWRLSSRHALGGPLSRSRWVLLAHDVNLESEWPRPQERGLPGAFKAVLESEARDNPEFITSIVKGRSRASRHRKAGFDRLVLILQLGPEEAQIPAVDGPCPSGVGSRATRRRSALPFG